jgi:sialate O-acetylesterase
VRLFALALLGTISRAEVTLAPLFTDHAVLQCDKVVPIWGTAATGEKVTVVFAGQQRQATPGFDGRWLVLLDPIPATAAGADLSVSGSNGITLHDVVVGEVWLCSGQSNMEFPLARALDGEREVAAANLPLIRHVRVEHVVAEQPADKVPTSGWEVATPQTAARFTAVGFFFARELQERLGVPVGIVHSSWGGTPIESWMSPVALAGNPAFAVVRQRWEENLANQSALRAAYEVELAGWTKREAEARLAGAAKAAAGKGKRTAPVDPTALHAAWLRQNPKPRAPRGPGDPWTPSGLFNGMINPLLPYALRGFLWYQGESNAERAGEYQALFDAMITAWRAHFGQGDLPFYWVNLANYAVPTDYGANGRSYALLRAAQTKTLALPNTGQALAIDVGDPLDIHPRNKQEVGRRLALLARNRIYGNVTDDSGPTFAGATREGAALRVRLAFTAGGLVAYGRPVQSLEIAGADGAFVPADGRIDRETLVVSSPRVREPVAVRYAWTNAPEANLYNGAGLPAVPFSGGVARPE